MVTVLYARRSPPALVLLLCLLVPGCRPQAMAPAERPGAAGGVRVQALALWALTPGVLPHSEVVFVWPTVAPTPTPTADPGRTRSLPFTPTAIPPMPALVSSPTVSPPAVVLAATPESRPAADRPPDRITAPAIGLDAPVVEVGWHLVERDGLRLSEWDVANHAAGFHKGSAYPGHVGNTVLSGHHNTRGEVFRRLVELKPGDQIALYVGAQAYSYRVERVFIVAERDVPPEQRQDNARWIGVFPDERLTLVTCWPYTGNTHRVIAVAYPTRGGS